MAQLCTSCQRELTMIEKMRTLSTPASTRCNGCNARYTTLLQQWAQQLNYAFSTGGVSPQFEQEMYRRLNLERVPEDLGNPFVAHMQSLRHQTQIRRWNRFLPQWKDEVENIYQQEGISTEVEQRYYDLLVAEQVPPNLGRPFVTRIKELRQKTQQKHWKKLVDQWTDELIDIYNMEGPSRDIGQMHLDALRKEQIPDDTSKSLVSMIKTIRETSAIQPETIPQIKTSIYLDSDEIAHYDWDALYFKPNKNERIISGRIIVTNKKLRFLSKEGDYGVTIDWNNIGQVQVEIIDQPYQTYTIKLPVIRIAVTKGSGGGKYAIHNVFEAKTAIEMLVKLWKRQLVLYKEQATKGQIPEHIKAAVFQRDGGCCCQCGYQGEYLEYDHIYPRSKGGANTVDNIQLLCRKCNLQKGARV